MQIIDSLKKSSLVKTDSYIDSFFAYLARVLKRPMGLIMNQITRLLLAPSSKVTEHDDICRAHLVAAFSIVCSLIVAIYWIVFSSIFDPKIHHPM